MTMQQKRSNEPGKMPTTADLADGQISVNTNDAILFMRKSVAGVQSVVRIGAEMSAPVAATLKEATLPAFRGAVGTLGDGQSWQNVLPDRDEDTTYSNTSGRPICVAISAVGTGAALSIRPASGSWVAVASADASGHLAATAVVPPGHEYRLTASGTITVSTWAELR